MLVNRMKFAVLMAWLASTLTVPVAQAAQGHITSEAELTRYMHHAAPSSSPLDSLSPGGRKRFLGEFKFE